MSETAKTRKTTKATKAGGSTKTNGFLDLELEVEVRLGVEQVPLQLLLALEPGGVLPLKQDPDQPVDLVVNDSVVASGELVVVDGKFGLRVTTTTQQRLANLDNNLHPASQS